MAVIGGRMITIWKQGMMSRIGRMKKVWKQEQLILMRIVGSVILKITWKRELMVVTIGTPTL